MSYERITRHDSPNFTPKSKVSAVFGISRNITSITIHHWGDPRANATFAGVINWLCRKGGSSSAHAVIEAGRVAYLVDYKDASWSTGNARGNATTIGLELHPRASAGDYETAGEHIADIWLSYGILPLKAHKQWKATECPGKWNLDKLADIAHKYYNKKAKAKQKPNPSIPAKKTYTVKKGDTLYRIANNNNTNVAHLVKLNKINNSRIIHVGQIIRLN